MDRADAATMLALAVGLLLVVFVENLLRSFGLVNAGYLVWIVGYGGIAVGAWYAWIRPLEFDPRAPESVWEGDDAAGETTGERE